MHRVLLVRHGESIWNHSSKFTGWTNIPLTENGKLEALQIAKTLKEKNIIPDVFFSSVLDRAIDTTNIIKNSICSSSPIFTSWRLNEKHYGTLEGLPRGYMRDEYGSKFTNMLRTNYYMKPPVIPEIDRKKTEYNVFKNCYFDTIKNGESKENVLNRALPYFENDILCTLNDNRKPIIVSHKHSIRVLMKYYLDLTDEEFESYKLPDNTILQMNFDENIQFINHEYIPF